MEKTEKTEKGVISSSGRFVKKPVEVSAVQFTRELIEERLFDNAPLPDGVVLAGANYHPKNRTIQSCRFLVETLEGDMEVSEGDWIITGVKGEHYPCKPDIFAATYEPAPKKETNP